MTSFNHSTIIKGFEKLVGKTDPSDFFSTFLKALKFSATTIKRLVEPNSSRNVALKPGDFALTKQIYFHPAPQGTDLQAELHPLLSDDRLAKHQIRFFLATDFEDVVAYDRRVDDWISFAFQDFRENYEFFLPLTGLYEKPIVYTEHPADVKACDKMGRLYDVIRAQNHYDKSNLHHLNVFLTRLLFCFFAEDTGIFPKPGQLTEAIESITQADGSDMADFFDRLFKILDTPSEHPNRKAETIVLASFPYVNGGLFHERICIPHFNARSRNILLECAHLTWSEISPVIFGAMFQAVMDPDARHERGAHYTSEKNILRVIEPLFLDDLRTELDKLLSSKSTHKIKKLKEFQSKLSSLKFLDPACGCGNFLIVTYHELKKLELKAAKIIYQEMLDKPSLFTNWQKNISQVSISQFYGIEIEEFPVEIARVSMWLMEHVINLEFSKSFGQLFPSIPLKDSANIVNANALSIDWNSVVPLNEVKYIFGNPPFAGTKKTTDEQKNEIKQIFHGESVGYLDYVACWFKISSSIMQDHPDIQTAFVSTNSLYQGEQVATLWSRIFNSGQVINFAHQTFRWQNEAKNNAAVYCCIAGFGSPKRSQRKLFLYSNINGAPSCQFVDEIGPYLIPNSNTIVRSTNTPLSPRTPMVYGNKPSGKAFFITPQEKKNILSKEPEVSPYFRRFYGAEEFLNGKIRYCLWFANLTLEQATKLKTGQDLASKIKIERTDKNTGKLKPQHAGYPFHIFRQITQPSDCDCLLIPIHSSERREYIPMGYIQNGDIIGN